MKKKDVLRKWNGFFSRQLAKGYTWNQIRHVLANKGYKAFSIEWLIRRYKQKQVTQHRIVTIFLALAFTLMLATPFILRMTGLTGFAVGVPNTYYVDATNGNDANDGLTPETAIKTITKVNSLRLYPGDSVRFKCGEVWRFTTSGWFVLKYSGDASGYITYSSYGNCNGHNKPLFLGSYDLSNAAAWESDGNNIWISKGNISEDIGNLIFNNEALGGNKKPDVASLAAQGDFYHNGVQDKLFVYSTTNPGSYYSHIEASTWAKYERDMFDFYNRHHLNFTGLSLRYGFTGFGCFECNNIIIKNNEIGFMGAPYQSGTLRYGDGIDIALNSNNIYIGYNNVTDCWDSCIGSQAWLNAGNRTITNHVIEYNIVKNCAFGYGHFNSDLTSNTKNITVRHNTIINSGYGIFCPSGDCYVENGRQGGRGMILDRSPQNTTQFNVIDNIIFNSSFRTVDIAADKDWRGELNLDYNIHYIGGRYFLLYNGTNYNSLIDLNSHSGQEEHGLQANPLFVGNTYTPSRDSPACAMSSTGSYVGALPCESEPEPLPEPFCGDLTCDVDENCSTCESDCGVCPEEQQPSPICGDGECNGVENCSACEADCGACMPEPLPEPFCGDATCDANESCDTCTADCGECHVVPSCGDGSCNGLENCSTCDSDCGSCPIVGFCGDSACDADENCSTCSADCGSCPILLYCGDATCGSNETCSSCEADCGACPVIPVCGDGSCNGIENCSTCLADCGTCPVNTTASTTSTRKGGGGGGGGGSSSTSLESDWTCESWSDCINGKQTQVCTHKTRGTVRTNSKSCKIEAAPSTPVVEEKESVTVPKKETVEEEQVTETPTQEVEEQVPGTVVSTRRITDYPFVVGLISITIVLVFMISTHYRPSKKSTVFTQAEQPERDYKNELEDYYEKATKAGYTTEEVKSELLRVGWKTEVIERFISNPSEKNMVEKEAAVAEEQVESANLDLNEPSETVIEILFKQHTSNLDNQVNTSIPLSKTYQEEIEL